MTTGHHVVSLRIFIDRSTGQILTLENENTRTLDQYMIHPTMLLEEFDIDRYIAAIVRCFDARAPVQYIASQLCCEVVRICSELVNEGIQTLTID